jgi:hypothetical protein
LKEDIYKTEFVCTGSKNEYTVKFYNTNSNILAETNQSGSIHYIIMLDNCRIDTYFSNPSQMITYAKKAIYAKGRGKFSEGKARVLVVDERTKKEVLAAIVEKLTTRYFEPVNRFKRR